MHVGYLLFLVLNVKKKKKKKKKKKREREREREERERGKKYRENEITFKQFFSFVSCFIRHTRHVKCVSFYFPD